MIRPNVFQAGLGQATDERRFCVSVAQDVSAVFDLVDAPARIVLVDNAAPRFGRVIERQSRAQPGVLPLRFEGQAGLRTGVDLLIAQLFGQIEPWRPDFAQGFGHEGADLIFGNGEGADAAQDRNPVKSASVVERGGAFRREYQAALKDQRGLRQIAQLLATAQNAFDNVLVSQPVVAANTDRKPPRFALLPFDQIQFIRIASRLQIATPGPGDQWQDDLRQRRGEAVSKRRRVVSVLVIVAVIAVIHLLARTGEHGEYLAVARVGQTGDLPSRDALFARLAPLAVLFEVLNQGVEYQMLRFKRGLDVDYVNNPARRRPLFAGSGEYRAIVESERGQLLLPTRELRFRAAPAEKIDHVPGRLVEIVIRPFVVIIVVEVAGA